MQDIHVFVSTADILAYQNIVKKKKRKSLSNRAREKTNQGMDFEIDNWFMSCKG